MRISDWSSDVCSSDLRSNDSRLWGQAAFERSPPLKVLADASEDSWPTHRGIRPVPPLIKLRWKKALPTWSRCEWLALHRHRASCFLQSWIIFIYELYVCGRMAVKGEIGRAHV